MATTLDLYYPFDAGAGANVTEAQWRDMTRHYLTAGYLKGEALEALVFADSTGRQVKVNTGDVHIRGHYGRNTSTKTLAVAANATGVTRYDRVVARLDMVNNRVELDVVTGTAAAAGPALTTTSTIWEISLAVVTVANGAVTLAAGTVTDNRYRAVPAHGAGGQIAFAEVTANQSDAGGGAEIDLTGLAFTIAPNVGNRRLRLTADLSVASTTTTDHVTLYIKEGATYLQQRSIPISRANVAHLVTATALLTPAAGVHTYKLALARVVGGGTVTMIATAGTSAYFLAEDLGPA